MRQGQWHIFSLGVLIAVLLYTVNAHANSRAFGGWAVAVVAGDWRSGSGHPTSVFDNARRDVSAALVHAGFTPGNIRQFSTASLDPGALRTDLTSLSDTWFDLTRKAASGCLLYLTSHGSPDGIVLGQRGMMSPRMLDMLLDLSCGERPTVVIISACYSGAFVPALTAANRMVLTASRADRSSFGCGTDTTYPYFDGCLIKAISKTGDFLALAAATRTCIAASEKAQQLSPPSEPQLSVGHAIRAQLPRLSLRPD